MQIIHIVNGALNGRKRSAFLRQGDAGLHGMVADELHDLRAELLAGFGTIANPDVVHEISQAHDAEADPACLMGCLGKLRHCGNVGVGLDNVVQEAG